MKTKNYFFKSLLALIFTCFILNAYASNLPPSCAQGDLTLQINFDNNHDDINWAIYNSDYNPITGGGPFTSQSQNATVTVTLPSNYFLSGNGNYNLVVYDRSGNGMSNGSYTLSENGNIIAQSSNFTYSQATTFCHGNTASSPLDITPPTNPTNAMVSSTTNNSITLEWDASTDSQSLLAYQIIIDDSLYADSTLTPEYTFSAVAGTFYDIKIFAYDRMGNISVQAATITVSTNGSNTCASGSLSLNLDFDAHPNEVSWQIKDSNYTIVDRSDIQGNSYYTNAAPNSSITEVINSLSSGDYILVIYDANGNGGTNYSLSDTSNTLISGTTTGYSDVIQFCVGNTSFTLDNIAPTDPLNLNIVNLTSDYKVELSWDISTDNEAVTEYGIFLFNSSLSTYIHYPLGSSTTTTYTTPTLPAGTNSISIVARDEAGNFSNKSNNVILSVPTFTTVHEGFFETGWDNWIDGGSNAARPSNNRAYEGNRSVRLRNGTNTSKITLTNQPLSGYTAVEFSFYFTTRGIENNETFTLEFNDGTSWSTIKTFSKPTDYRNNRFYNVNATLSSNDYNFNNSSSFRIMLQGNENNDRVFIDQTKIVGINGGLHNSSVSINEVVLANRVANTSKKEDDLSSKTDDIIESLILYPNPTSDYFKFNTTEGLREVNIYTLNGVLIKTFKEIDPSAVFIIDIKKETYIVKALYYDEWKTFKLIVK
ncbi:T9SS type A sorting domain-containing protein [Winogradskyella flava]|uniref:T9SS type A sorting domain-containing protein n=1 Tax=Winogradskyella flava TaxID=1884876 RepID=UPI00248F4A9D|nr:T9SS type A sorting domain-containing protein [Winogradskyella flava]